MRIPICLCAVAATLLTSMVPVYAQTASPTAKALVVEAMPGLSDVQKRFGHVAGSSRGLDVTAWVDRIDATYAPGDAIALYVKPNRDAHITVLNIGPTGKVSVLFPNSAAPDNRVEAHRVLRIGGPEAGYRLRAEGPSGRELIKVIATDRPLDLIAYGDSDAAGAFRVLRGESAVIADRLSGRIATHPDTAIATRMTTVRIVGQ